MTTRSRSFVILAILAVSTAPALAQNASIKMAGRCERLVIADQDITQNCKEELVNNVSRGRTTFDFAAWDGQTLSFSGAGAQQEGTEMTEPLQPISLVVPGRKEKDAIVRNPAPAVGACRFSKPEAGKTMIACEANSQGKTYAGTFVTDAKQPEGGQQQDGAKP